MNEREIFLSALEFEDVDLQKAFLRTACEGQPEMLADVEALLAVHNHESEYLNTPVVVQMATASRAEPADTIRCDSSSTQDAALPKTEFTAYGDQTMSENPGTNSDEFSLSYLQPSSRADSLGRLGHYEIHEVLGRGAFGTVLKGFDEKLERVVAIKVLAPEMAATSPARKRFLREARASAAVRHDNVVDIHAVEEYPLPYLVMEYIPGQTLQQRLDEHGPLEVADVLRLGRQIAEGLAAAHAQNLIHRDIKPGNILLENSIPERVKITDFGLARAADDASLTQSSVIAGTPMYMAPEQAMGQELDQRADLFSLGSVLYQMVSGRPPFRASNTLAVLKRVTEDSPRPIREVIPETPKWLCDIITTLHAKNPADRFQSAKDVVEILIHCESHLSTPTRLIELPRKLQPRSARRNYKAVTVAVLVVALLLIAGYGFTRWSQPAGIHEKQTIPVSVGSAGKTQSVVSASVSPAEQSPPAKVATDDTKKPTSIDPAETKTKQRPSTEAVAAIPATTVAPPVNDETVANNSSDRAAAEYVLSHGGTVQVAGINAELKDRTNLPVGAVRLTKINFWNTRGNSNSLTDAGLSVLKDCRHVTDLNLGVSDVTDAGLSHFRNWDELQHLTLAYAKVTDAGLLNFKRCKKLEQLNLYNTSITGDAFVAFKDCDRLTHLLLRSSTVTDAGLAHLKHCRKLIHLELAETGITDAGLMNFRDCNSLGWLLIANTAVGDAGLAQFNDCTTLVGLDLSGTLVTDDGLAGFKECQHLTHINVINTSVTDAGLKHLAALGKLIELKLQDSKVTEQGVQELARMLPSCAIEWNGGIIGPLSR